jgi:AcrR family transcriptional regulator
MAIAAGRAAAKGDETRERIKRCAAELFARYGIDSVTIRDIAKHAGQKNGGSVNYYFRSKDDLILEILDEAASEADQLRLGLLDRLEASGRPITVREILRILVSFPAQGRGSMRLFTMLQTYRRDLMHTAIPGRWDRAYQRCVVHLRRLSPHLSEVVLMQRLYFLIPYLWTFLATREGGEDQAQFWKGFWALPYTMENFLDTAEGVLNQRPSADTLRLLDAPAGSTTLSAPARRSARGARKHA